MTTRAVQTDKNSIWSFALEVLYGKAEEYLYWYIDVINWYNTGTSTGKILRKNPSVFSGRLESRIQREIKIFKNSKNCNIVTKYLVPAESLKKIKKN